MTSVPADSPSQDSAPASPAGPARPSPAPGRPRSWLTIREASALVGVSEATLRRWSEAGDVEVFVTPGGHRRFTRSGLAKLFPKQARPARTLRELGETPERVVRQYRRELDGAPQATWLERLDPARLEAFREPGRRILSGVLGYLDAPTPDAGEAALDEARAASAAYGRLAAELDLDMTATTDAFLRFRSPFLEELASIVRRRHLDANQAISLIIAAASVFDRLLLVLLDGRAQAASARPVRKPVRSAAPRSAAPQPEARR